MFPHKNLFAHLRASQYEFLSMKYFASPARQAASKQISQICLLYEEDKNAQIRGREAKINKFDRYFGYRGRDATNNRQFSTFPEYALACWRINQTGRCWLYICFCNISQIFSIPATDGQQVSLLRLVYNLFSCRGREGREGTVCPSPIL